MLFAQVASENQCVRGFLFPVFAGFVSAFFRLYYMVSCDFGRLVVRF